tara:strand:+ start:723 stop:1133 length:411 start_codon:yes stop_codon:yes gene_type:complete
MSDVPELKMIDDDDLTGLLNELTESGGINFEVLNLRWGFQNDDDFPLNAEDMSEIKPIVDALNNGGVKVKTMVKLIDELQKLTIPQLEELRINLNRRLPEDSGGKTGIIRIINGIQKGKLTTLQNSSGASKCTLRL